MTYTQSARWSMRSLIAGVITEKLIEDGILGKTLFIRTTEDGTVYEYKFCVGLKLSAFEYNSEEAMRVNLTTWTPSIIEHETWDSVVEDFRLNYSLRYNVEHYLIPQLRKQIEELSSDELTGIALDAFEEYGIINCPIKKTEDEIFYFDETLNYSTDTIEAFNVKFGPQNLFLSNRPMSWPSFNYNVWWEAVDNFRVGMKLEDCVRIYINTELICHRGADWPFIDRLVQNIVACYEREPFNKNTKTFDRIRVSVNLGRYLFETWDELKQAVKAHRSEIDKKVLEKIENDRRFRKYNVPINVLSLSDLVLRRDYTLEYIFELKI